MKINLKEIKIYFLTTGNNLARKNNILNIFKDYNIIEVNPILGIPRLQSGSIGMGRIIDLGLRNQNRQIPFQPFMLIEDDVSFYRELPETIEIPDDSDLFYTGVSSCGANGNTYMHKVLAEIHSNDILRIYSMLSCHGIIIGSELGALLYQRCMTESYYKNINWDLPLAHCQQFYKCYAFKKPLFYQDARLGGQQGPTKVELKNYEKPENIPVYSDLTYSLKMIPK